MPVFGVEVPASSLQDLDYASVETKVKKSMGAKLVSRDKGVVWIWIWTRGLILKNLRSLSSYDGQGATKK